MTNKHDMPKNICVVYMKNITQLNAIVVNATGFSLLCIFNVFASFKATFERRGMLVARCEKKKKKKALPPITRSSNTVDYKTKSKTHIYNAFVKYRVIGPQ